MKKRNKPLIIFIVVLSVLLAVEAAIVMIIDPFFHYHKPLNWFPYIIDNQQSQNPGIAKFLDYDNVLLGSSMVSNFDTSKFGGKGRTQKISYNAATAKDIANSLDMVLDAHPDLNKAYICVDLFNWIVNPDLTGYELPEYLYDNNPFNDVEYLFNSDVLVDYCIKPLFTPEDKTDIDRVYHLEFAEELYNKDFAMSHYVLGEITDDISVEKYIPGLKANLDKNILPYIEAYPETEFVFFFPPYSIIYWYELDRTKNIDAVLYAMQYLYETVAAYENVCIYDFSMLDGMEDMNNYIDPKHYHERLCGRMGEEFGKVYSEYSYNRLEELYDSVYLYGYKENYELPNLFE